jgi:ABC-type sugar transport system permease subunit
MTSSSAPTSSAPGTPPPPPPTREAAPLPAPDRGISARRDNRDGWTLLAPTLIIVVVIVILPVLWNIVLAFQDLSLVTMRKTGMFGNFTLENFVNVFTDARFWKSLRITLVYSVASTVGSIVVGLICALVLRRPFPGRGLLRALMLLPYVAPVVAATFVWKVMLDGQSGIVNHWGTTLLGWDEPINFLGTKPYALLTVIAFEIWRYFPFAFLFITARLLTVPADLEEAATVDGATIWQNFRFVILPQLTSVIALLAVLRMVMTFNKFDDVYLLTGGTAGTEVAAVRVIDTLSSSFDIGAAAAEALALSAVLAVFLVIYVKYVNRYGVQGS